MQETPIFNTDIVGLSLLPDGKILVRMTLFDEFEEVQVALPNDWTLSLKPSNTKAVYLTRGDGAISRNLA